MTIVRCSLVLVALFAVLIGAAWLFNHGGQLTAHQVAKFLMLTSGAVAFGAVTITYTYPIAGVTAPTPTLAKAAGFPGGAYNTVRGNVIATADGDTTAALTHNFALSAGALAAGQPELTPIPLHAAFWLSEWTFVYTNGNVVTGTKTTAGSSGNAAAQLGFIIRRPNSIAI